MRLHIHIIIPCTPFISFPHLPPSSPSSPPSPLLHSPPLSIAYPRRCREADGNQPVPGDVLSSGQRAPPTLAPHIRLLPPPPTVLLTHSGQGLCCVRGGEGRREEGGRGRGGEEEGRKRRREGREEGGEGGGRASVYLYCSSALTSSIHLASNCLLLVPMQLHKMVEWKDFLCSTTSLYGGSRGGRGGGGGGGSSVH